MDIHGWIGALQAARLELNLLIDHLPDKALLWQAAPEIYSIGALLLHIGYTEASWLGERVSDEGRKYLWDDSVDNTPPPPLPLPLSWYQEFITTTRLKTVRKLLRAKKGNGIGSNRSQTLQSIPRRLLEHEFQHRGQIAVLKRLYQQTHSPVYS